MRVTTSDLYEAGFLLYSHNDLIEIWSDQNKRRPTAAFTFDGPDDLSDQLKTYRLGTATVNLADYRRNLETIKDRMFECIRNAAS